MSGLLSVVVVLYVAIAYVIAGVASTRHLRLGHSRLVYAVWVVLVVAAPVSVPAALAFVVFESRRAR